MLDLERRGEGQRRRREHAGGVAGVHARLLDVLHDRGDVDLLAVAERVHVELDRVLDEAVEQDRSADGGHGRLELVVVVADAHRPAAEHVRGPDEHRVADLLGRRERLVRALDDRPRRAAHAELLDERAEALAVLGQVDRRMRRSQDAVAGLLDVPREPERRLAAELGDDAHGLLAVADGEHLLGRERLEVEAVGGVVVGGDGLRVAVDHDRLVAERAERLRRVDAAVVELDPLPDPVRPRAEDDDARLVAVRRGLVLLAPGGVEVVRGRLDLAGARVDAPERRAQPRLVPSPPHLGAADAERRADRVVAPARPLRSREIAARELLLRGRDLLAEPWMEAVRQILVRRLAHGVGEPWSSSREPNAFRNASVKVRPIPIASPTDFICVPSVRSAPGNFSNAKRGNFTTT